MPLPLTVSCFSKIQIGFTFLVPAHLGSPGERAVKRVCVCVYNIAETLIWFHSFQCLIVQHGFSAIARKMKVFFSLLAFL